MLDHPETTPAAIAKHRQKKRVVKRKHIAIGFGTIVALATGTVTLLDAWNKVLVFVHLKDDPAFVLAEQTAKGELARTLVHSIAQRDFWIRRYSGDLGAGFPASEQDDAWKRYNDSVIDWNESYLTNYFMAGKYFNADVQKRLADINWIFRAINACMNQIHYRSLYTGDDGVCHLVAVGGVDGANQDQSQDQNIAAINKTADYLDRLFTIFLDELSK